MTGFCCPVCGQPLERGEGVYGCVNGHRYDIARSGYVNLLLANGKHSKSPGDDRLMVNARRAFLEKGYYEPLRNMVTRQAAALLARFPDGEPTVLDAGCGEGYYTNGLWEYLQMKRIRARVLGVDISKVALQKAARKDGGVYYAAGSVFHLPVPQASCNLVLNLFAPFCMEEISRVLLPGGCLMLAIPAKEHLWELKRAVYDQPYYNEPKDPALEGFRLLKTEEAKWTMELRSTVEIEQLFQMTPYYYKTAKQDYAKLQKLESLLVTASFQLLSYAKEPPYGA